MKKWMMLLVLPLVLTGCGTQETFETVSDEQVLSVMAHPRQIRVDLPEEAVAPVLESEGEQMYLCDGYDILIEVRASGDLARTLRDMSGYEGEDLTVVQTQWDDVSRYEFVWASAGEEGDRLGRGVVLDDGDYHYCMSILRDADMQNSQILWDQVFSSFGVDAY